jgi:spermidine synthase
MQHGTENTALLLAISVVILLLPTTLLGATFPAMAAIVRQLSNTTRSTGLFYGFNTLGAVVGCVVVSFWLLPSLGQRYTTWSMTIINISIALVFWLGHHLDFLPVAKQNAAPDQTLAESSQAQTTSEQQIVAHTSPDLAHTKIATPISPTSSPDVVANTSTVSIPCHQNTPVLSPILFRSLAVGSGCLAIGIQVLWTRALALSFPSTVYVFTLVLAAYLVGIGFGSLWVGVAFRKRAPQRENLWLFYLAIGIGSLCTLWLFAQITPISLYLLQNQWVASWGAYMVWIGLSAVIAMLPATLVMGAAFPILIGMATNNTQKASRIAGQLYALNTIGGVIGSLCVTFLFMPLLGLSQTLFFLAFGYVILALVVSWHATARQWLRLSSVAVLGLAALIWNTDQYPKANPLKYRHNQELLFYRDSSSATIAIYRDQKGVRSLRINNYYGLSNTNIPTISMQYRLGHIPMMLHPNPERALLIGFATGTTLAAMAQHPAQQIDCVEIHKDIINLSHFFKDVNHDIKQQSPRVRLIAEDGRRYIMRTDTKYDLIVGDLYLLRNPGVGRLYSVEHFSSVSNKLSPDGIFVAWLPLFQLHPMDMASIIRSFLQVFKNAEGWVAQWDSNLAIIGLVGKKSSQPIQAPPNFEQQLNKWLDSSIAKAKEINSSPSQPLESNVQDFQLPISSGTVTKSKHACNSTHLSAQPQNARRLLTTKLLIDWANTAPINRLELPVIEFSAPRVMVQAQIQKSPLALQNIRQISRLVSLENTPWQDLVRSFASANPPTSPPHSPKNQP